jgi:predicted negative regulator of RcsB-dependent stress response
VVQEEATKISKRAKRRAAGEGASEGKGAEDASADASSEDAEEEADADGDDEASAAEPGAPGVANRQARRTAAAKARARRKRERAEASAIGLDAGEMVDDALVRATDKVGRLARRYWNVIQWVIGIGVLAWFGYQVYAWRRASIQASASDILFDAVSTEQARIGDRSEQGKPNANGIIDPTPVFETEADREQAALVSYKNASEARHGTTAGAFAQLGQAEVLLETGQAEEARALFEQLAASSAAATSPELRGNATEGRGLSLEAKDDLGGALQAFEALASVPGFANRALYQQARIKHRQGDVGAAKGLLTQLFKNLGPPKAVSLGGLPERPEFLRERAEQLASVVDPLQKDVKIPKAPFGADAVQQMLEQLKEQGVVTPPAPTPAPSP